MDCRADYVIQEFLHHVVHPVAAEITDMVLASKRAWNGIDNSYYLSGDDACQLNAFEKMEEIRAQEPVLVCANPLLRDGTGEDLLRRVREEGYDMPVVPMAGCLPGCLPELTETHKTVKNIKTESMAVELLERL